MSNEIKSQLQDVCIQGTLLIELLHPLQLLINFKIFFFHFYQKREHKLLCSSSTVPCLSENEISLLGLVAFDNIYLFHWHFY